MRIGIDFGTTNSGAAYFDGERVHVLPIDRVSSDPTVMRSTLYVTREHDVSFGREALDNYYRQNVGRPSRMVREWVGEIEMTFASSLITFSGAINTIGSQYSNAYRLKPFALIPE